MDAGDFVVPVDKPEGPTSHDVVARARRALDTRRVGHTGTLDPFASGLLLLCVGRATRLAEYLTGLDKTYEAEALLGVETDTLDLQGEVVAEDGGWADLDEAAIRKALEGLTGTIEQVPPQYSAKKVGGEAMHRKARRGEAVELAPVPVTVHAMEPVEVELPRVRFTVRCSSGTYVRALARDIGKALGVGAHLTALRRTAVGRFPVADAVSLEGLEDGDAVAASRMSPLEAMARVESMRRIDVDEEQATRLRHGQRIRLPDASHADGVVTDEAGGESGDADMAAGPRPAVATLKSDPLVDAAVPRVVAVAHQDDLVAIGEIEGGMLRPRKVFAG